MKPELSRPLMLDQLSSKARRIAVEATTDERGALAQRFDVAAIKALKVKIEARRSSDLVIVRGRLRATVSQLCVVTGDIIDTRQDTVFTRQFMQTEAVSEPEIDDQYIGAFDEDDPPDAVAGGCIDLGELIAEEFALRLDPYPRTPGLPFTDVAKAPPGVPEETVEARDEGPFAALRTLKD